MNKGNNEKRSIWYALTKNSTKKQYNEKINELKDDGIELSREEKIALRHKYAKKNAQKAKVRTFLIALSISSGIGGAMIHGLLNPGVEGVTQNKTETVVDLDQIPTDSIEIVGSKREEFVKSLAAEANDKELESNIEQEIANLKTPEAVLEYIKNMYVQEYNQNSNEDISTEDIKLSKNTYDIVIYKDEAQNGEQILRYCSESQAQENNIAIDGDKCIVSVHIQNENINTRERVAYDDTTKQFETVYRMDEEVIQNEETTLGNVAEVILAGINMSTSMEQKDNNSYEINHTYKQRFIDAIKNYRTEQIEEIIAGNTYTEQSQEEEGFEP